MFSILHIHTIILFFPAKYINLNQLYETLVTHAQVLNTHKRAYKYNLYLN